METADRIADYFLATFDNSPPKLRCLLYFSQAFHLALHDDQPLFADPIEARDHSPVARDRPNHLDVFDYLPEHREILDAVANSYGQLGAEELKALMHAGPPWQEAYPDRMIATESTTRFFTPMVEAGKRGEAIEGHPVWPIASFRYQRRAEIAVRMAKLDKAIKRVARPGDCSPIWKFENKEITNVDNIALPRRGLRTQLDENGRMLPITDEQIKQAREAMRIGLEKLAQMPYDDPEEEHFTEC